MQSEQTLTKRQLQTINRHATELFQSFDLLMKEHGLGEFVITSIHITSRENPNGSQIVPFCSIGEEPAAVCDQWGTCSVTCIKP